MSTTLEIVVPTSSADIRYPIWIGHHLLHRLEELFNLDRYSNVTILSDTQIAPHWLAELRSGTLKDTGVCLLPPGESHKTMEAVQQIWSHLHKEGCDRHSLLLNLGGGVIGDLGGFAASTYMRGIDFLQIPTTLLSQVDASVGGKVGCNFAGVKNLVGAFNQPQGVLIDTELLRTLPQREYQSGWGEIIKHALIQDREYLDEILAFKAGPPSSGSPLAAIIERSCRLKAAVIEQDEKESGLRKILNFGHTVGHALESLSHQTGQPLLHGEAVGLGMIAEAEISVASGYLQPSDVLLVEQALQHFNLPLRIDEPIPWRALRAQMLTDKKNVKGQMRWTLLAEVGQAIFDVQVEEDLVEQSVQRLWTTASGHMR